MMQDPPWLPVPVVVLVACSFVGLAGAFLSQLIALAMRGSCMSWTPRRCAVSWAIWASAASIQIAAAYVGQDLLERVPDAWILLSVLGLYSLAVATDVVVVEGVRRRFGERR